MNRAAGRFFWGSVGSILAFVLIGSGAFNFTTMLAHGESTEVRHFDAAAVQRLAVRSANGRITVSAGDVDTVTVTAHISTSIGTSTHAHDEVLRDGTLALTSRCPWYSSWCSVRYTVIVPPSVTLDLHSGNGRVLVRGMDAPVSVHSSNGHISLIDLAGPINASTSNGWLEGHELRATAIDASTANGHLALDFAVPPHRVNTHTGNGWIEIHVPDAPGAYRVDATTHDGSRTVMVRTDPAAADSIVATADNGNVAVDYRSP